MILGYSTLVHPGDTWEEMRESVSTYAPLVKAVFSPDEPYAVSLRLSAASASTLSADSGECARFRRWLDDHGMYVYTVNAFPYGPFKGRRVMEQVYEPDWSTEARVRYTMQVADILAALTSPPVAPSIQTMPLAFLHSADVDLLTENVLRVVAHLIEVERRTASACRSSSSRPRRAWRTHFHVPIFLDDLGAFGTTRASIEAALAVHAETPLSDHLEIETYTWDVLPAHLKTADITDYVLRELSWLRDALQPHPSGADGLPKAIPHPKS